MRALQSSEVFHLAVYSVLVADQGLTPAVRREYLVAAPREIGGETLTIMARKGQVAGPAQHATASAIMAARRKCASGTWVWSSWTVEPGGEIPEGALASLHRKWAAAPKPRRVATPGEVMSSGASSRGGGGSSREQLTALDLERAREVLAGAGGQVQFPSTAPAPAPVVASPPPVPVVDWHYEGRKVSLPGILALVESRPDDRHLVWREGFSGWEPAREVPEIASLLAPRPPALPPIGEKAETLGMDPAVLAAMIAEAVAAAMKTGTDSES